MPAKGRPENLTPYQKGHKSTGGRPKGSVSIITSLKKLLASNPKKIPALKEITEELGCKTMADALAIRLMLEAYASYKGSDRLTAIFEIMNRIDGKQVEKNVNLDFDVSKMSDEELRQIIEN